MQTFLVCLQSSTVQYHFSSVMYITQLNLFLGIFCNAKSFCLNLFLHDLWHKNGSFSCSLVHKTIEKKFGLWWQFLGDFPTEMNEQDLYYIQYSHALGWWFTLTTSLPVCQSPPLPIHFHTQPDLWVLLVNTGLEKKDCFDLWWEEEIVHVECSSTV